MQAHGGGEGGSRGQIRDRPRLATLLELDRNTAGRWLDRYAWSGLTTLPEPSVPKSTPSPLIPDQLAYVQAALAQPEGFGSYDDIQP